MIRLRVVRFIFWFYLDSRMSISIMVDIMARELDFQVFSNDFTSNENLPLDETYFNFETCQSTQKFDPRLLSIVV